MLPSPLNRAAWVTFMTEITYMLHNFCVYRFTHLLGVLSDEKLEVSDGRILVAAHRVSGASHEERGQQLRVDAALLAHYADTHLVELDG